jgi:hypothetical protein
MTRETALKIKTLRAGGSSWRMVAIRIEGVENQIVGQELCVQAMQVLGETAKDWGEEYGV